MALMKLVLCLHTNNFNKELCQVVGRNVVKNDIQWWIKIRFLLDQMNVLLEEDCIHFLWLLVHQYYVSLFTNKKEYYQDLNNWREVDR